MTADSTNAGDIVPSNSLKTGVKNGMFWSEILFGLWEKQPEKVRDFFGVSNSSFFEIKIIFTESKPMFPIAHDGAMRKSILISNN